MLYSLLVRPSGVAAFQSRLFKDPSSSNLVFKDRTTLLLGCFPALRPGAFRFAVLLRCLRAGSDYIFLRFRVNPFFGTCFFFLSPAFSDYSISLRRQSFLNRAKTFAAP